MSILRLSLVTQIVLILSSGEEPERCPNGGEIFHFGITDDDKREIVEAHNQVRLDVANGRVPNQPRGVNLLRLSYDDKLGEEARVVSKTCKMDHVKIKDDRWEYVGQNIYIQWRNLRVEDKNFTDAVYNWYIEYKDFEYPNKTKDDKSQTGHYTQLVWAETKYVGCDFVFFNDTQEVETPYTKLYTCNYGPAGNVIGQAPYKTGDSGCENLC